MEGWSGRGGHVLACKSYREGYIALPEPVVLPVASEDVDASALDTHGVNAPTPTDQRIRRAHDGEYTRWWETSEGRIARSVAYREEPGEDETRVEEKYRRWRLVQRLSDRASVRMCGRVPIERDCGAVIDGAGVHEVRTCGSPWECPHCSVSLAKKRQHLALRIATGAVAAGYRAVLFLGTMRHEHGNDLRGDTNTILTAWRTLTSSKLGKRWMERHGLVAAIRGLEVTHGDNGWHPHVHAVFYTCHTINIRQLSLEAREIWETITGRIDTRAWGFEFPRNLEHAAEYAAKAGSSGVGYARESQSGQRWSSVWRWLDSGAIRDFYLWVEYGQGMKNRRGLGFVNRDQLMSWAGDEEVIDEVPDEVEDPVTVSGAWLQWLWNTRALRLLVGSRLARRTLAIHVQQGAPPAPGSEESLELLQMAVEAYYNTG